MKDIITISGNLSSEPEHKRLPNGTVITEFRVGSTHRRIDKSSGAWVDDETNWYAVSTFGRLAEHAFQSLHKGDGVVLIGRLKIRDWENGDQRGRSVDIHADAIGHDLRWGTSTFQKASSSRVGSSDPREDAPATTDEWAVPGGAETTDWPVTSVPATEGEVRPLELAGVEKPF